MKERTKELLAKIKENHDFIEGQVWSGGGTELHSTDTCQVCGLRRHWRKDPQNGVPSNYRFSRGNADIPMLLAVECNL